ncbi:hypothetical protein EIC00_24165 [Vibrio parahaemolyticus]|nr:hypothetical protein [Vibrio parahaemolyticus]EGR3234469.1 hypothetical protein [Vibrio parahaemolyticus]
MNNTQNCFYFLARNSFRCRVNHNFSLEHNAQLRGEQRYHTNLKHCAINTKFEVEAKVPSVENPS